MIEEQKLEAPDITPAGPAAVASSNPVQMMRVLWWVFFNPDQLDSFEWQTGPMTVRALAAWPAGLLIWFPLFLPILAMDLGIVTFWAGPAIRAGLTVACLLGWLIFVYLGRKVDPTKPTTSVRTTLVIFLGICSAAVLVVEVALMFALVNGYGIRVGGTFAFSFFTALVIALGVATRLEFGTETVSVALPGAVLIFLGVISIFGGIYLSSGAIIIYLFAIGALAATPFVAADLMKTKRMPHGQIVRMLGLAGLLASNGILVWIVFLNGWWILLGRPNL